MEQIQWSQEGVEKLIFHNNLREHLHAMIYMYFCLYPQGMGGYQVALFPPYVRQTPFFNNQMGFWWSYFQSFCKNIWHFEAGPISLIGISTDLLKTGKKKLYEQKL